MRTKLSRLFQAIRVLVEREGPMVRIRLPPALSQQRTGPSCEDSAKRVIGVLRSLFIRAEGDLQLLKPT
jgi:hypothetical protein